MIQESIIKTFRKYILNQLTGMCGSRELAEDAFQEACLSCLKSDKEYLVGGLYIVAKRKMIDVLRIESKRIKVPLDYKAERGDFIDLLELEEKTEREQQVLKDVQDIILNFTPNQKKVFAHRLNGATFVEISEKEKMNLNTALGAWHHGIELLRLTFN